MTATRIPCLELDVSVLAPAHRVEAWKTTFSRFYELPTATNELEARGRMLRLGDDAVLTDTVQPKHFIRDPAAARRDGADMLLISLEVAGGVEIETADGTTRVGEGRVTVFDMARPTHKRGPAGRTLVLGVGRDLVEAVLPRRDLHGLTLPRGELLAEHIDSLSRRLPEMPAASAPNLLRSAVEVLAACIDPEEERLTRARPALTDALLRRARRYIRSHADDPGLSPERVAFAAGASRASLYRAFEAEGGVAAAIRRIRLQAARDALRDADDPRRVGEIAFAHGFSSEAQFSRAFRSAFDTTPTEVRQAALARSVAPPR